MIGKRQKPGYDELLYVLPPITAKKAASIAIRKIEAARQLDVGYLVYLLQHSNILLLAGLRASSPYVNYSVEMSGRRLTRFEQYLKSIGLYSLPESNISVAGQATSYTLVSPKAIQRLPDIYGFLNNNKPLWSRQFEPTDDGFTIWSFEVERNLAIMMEDGKLPRTWLYDWWAPHNLRFGMLLGYPGTAISSLLWSESTHKQTGKVPHSVQISMYEHDEMLGAEVNYYVAKEVVNAPEVVALYELWNTVVKEVIDHFASYDLEHNKMFLSEYKSYRKNKAK